MSVVFTCCFLLLEVPFLEFFLEDQPVQSNSLQVLDRIISGIEQFGFRNEGWIESPLKGAEGNIEFLACFHRIPMSEVKVKVQQDKPICYKCMHAILIITQTTLFSSLDVWCICEA